MLTKNVCRKCERYFPNITNGTCPICDGMLRDVNLSPWENYSSDNRLNASTYSAKKTKSRTAAKTTPFSPSQSPNQPKQTENKPVGAKRNTSVAPFNKDKSAIQPPPRAERTFIRENNRFNENRISIESENTKNEVFFSNTSITGEIIESTERTDNRLIISQLYLFLFYGQPFGRKTNLFIIRDEENRTHFANAYGEISGGGAHPAVHSLVEVTGRYNRHQTLLIRRMRIKNGPDVRFKTPADVVHDILHSLRIPIVLLLLIAILFWISSNITSISSILLTILFVFGIVYIVLECFTRAVFFNKWRGRSRFCFIVSAIITVAVIIYFL